MWYLGSLLVLAVFLTVATILGVPLAAWGSRGGSPAHRDFLAPALGAAVLVLLATLAGWWGPGFRRCGGALWLAAAGAGLWWHGRLGLPGAALLGTIGRVLAFALVASLPVLLPVLRFSTFDPFNDTLTYFTQAQWLQTHGFSEQALCSGHAPNLAQVTLYQATGLRMGASFLLALLQGASFCPWSYEVYPAAAAAGLVTGSLAVAGFVVVACPGRRTEAWLCGLGAALGLNGWSFGAYAGYYPQTWGLSFGTAALALRALQAGADLDEGPRALRRGSFGVTSPGERWSRSLALALCTAAAVFCYTEFIPFLAAALALSFLVPWPHGQRAWHARWQQFWPPLLLTGLLVNFECVRACQALVGQFSAVVGAPVAWHWWDFCAHAAGWRSAYFDGNEWWFPTAGQVAGRVSPWVLAECSSLLAGTWLFLAYRRTGSDPLPARGSPRPLRHALCVLAPAGILLALYGLAFVYFRRFAADPWSEGGSGFPPGVGQSWSQFKLSGWASPEAAVVGSVGLLLLGQTPAARWPRLVVASWLAVGAGIGLGWHYGQAEPRTSFFLQTARARRDGFAAYRVFGEAFSAHVKPGDTVYLEAGPDAFKSRQLLAYFLQSLRLAGDWAADPGMLPEFLPEAERSPPAADCAWLIRLLPVGENPSRADAVGRPGGFLVEHGPRRPFALDRISGAYDPESGRDGISYWSAHAMNLVFVFDQPRSPRPPETCRLRFQARTAQGRSTVTVTVRVGEGNPTVATFPLEPGWTDYTVPLPANPGASVECRLETAASPVRLLPSNDPRDLAFCVLNPVLEVVPTPAAPVP